MAFDTKRVSLVTVLIKPDGAGSLLTLNHREILQRKSPRRPPQGLEQMLDKLVQYLS